MNKPIGVVSIDTKTIFDRIVKAEVGELISYDELRALVNRNVQGDSRYLLVSAARKALVEKNIAFETVPSRGIRRLDDAEIVDAGGRFLAKARRSVKRGFSVISLGVRDFEALPNDVKVKHNLYLAMAGAVAHLMGPAGMRRVAAAVEKSKSALPIQKTLDVFRGDGGGRDDQ